MENVFEEMLAEGTSDNITEQEEASYDNTYDLSLEDLSTEDSTDSSSEHENVEDLEEDNTLTYNENPTNKAFAQMRTQNKEYSQKIAEIDALAKTLGMQNIDDFIAKAKDAQTQLEAKKTGLPVEVAKELAEMRSFRDSMIADKQKAEIEAKERTFASNVQSFVESNKLSKDAVDKLSQDLEKDGLQIDALMDMPKAALNRILSSYVGSDYQKSLERKNAIKKELPISQTSKVDTESINKSLDNLAKQLAGKI